MRPLHGGGGGIRTHASLAAQGFSKPSQWTNYATPPIKMWFDYIRKQYYWHYTIPTPISEDQSEFFPSFERIV